jgi:predicted anti-sigma-YlaC factor YlaD
MNETISLVGEVELKLNDVVVVSKKNLIVQVGKNFLANAVISSSTTPFNAIAIGRGTTAAALTDTALQTEILRTSFDSATIANNVITLVKNYLPGVATGLISEAGIFNNATSGGTMLSHIVFTTIGKQDQDRLLLTWTITVG